MIVSSEITHSSGPPTRIDWDVRTRDGAMKIDDVQVEGISMALTEREEIDAAIQRNGGTVASLNHVLADHVSAETADAGAGQ